MRKFQQYITEGVYDPSIFKAFFLAGGPGSGKSWVSARALSGMGLIITPVYLKVNIAAVVGFIPLANPTISVLIIMLLILKSLWTVMAIPS